MRARDSRSSSTSRTRSVMSCTTPIMRAGRPCASSSKPTCEASQITSPSRRMSRRSHDAGSPRRYASSASRVLHSRSSGCTNVCRYSSTGARTARRPRPASCASSAETRSCASAVDHERAELRDLVRAREQVRLVAQLRERERALGLRLLALVDVLDDARVEVVLPAEHREVDPHPRFRAVGAEIALLVADRRHAGDQLLDRRAPTSSSPGTLNSGNRRPSSSSRLRPRMRQKASLQSSNRRCPSARVTPRPTGRTGPVPQRGVEPRGRRRAGQGRRRPITGRHHERSLGHRSGR